MSTAGSKVLRQKLFQLRQQRQAIRLTSQLVSCILEEDRPVSFACTLQGRGHLARVLHVDLDVAVAMDEEHRGIDLIDVPRRMSPEL